MMFGLKEATINQIHSILEKYTQIEKAILYGSRAKGNFRNGSDIDLTLVGGPELTLKILYRLMDDIDDLLLPYLFDLSLYHMIQDQEVREHIERKGKVFYTRTVRQTA